VARRQGAVQGRVLGWHADGFVAVFGAVARYVCAIDLRRGAGCQRGHVGSVGPRHRGLPAIFGHGSEAARRHRPRHADVRFRRAARTGAPYHRPQEARGLVEARVETKSEMKVEVTMETTMEVI